MLNKAKNSALDDVPRISKIDPRKKAVHVFVGAADTVRIVDNADDSDGYPENHRDHG